MNAALWFNHRCNFSSMMQYSLRVCFPCCTLIWIGIVFAHLLRESQQARFGWLVSVPDPAHNPSGSKALLKPMFFSSNSPAVSEEDWDRSVKCFDNSNLSLTVAFDVGWAGFTNQHTALLHGFAVAYLLGANAVVEPRLRIGLNHESSQLNNFSAIVAEANVSGSAKSVSFQYYYDNARINEVLKQLNMTMVPEPPRNVESVGLELHTDMRGERMHAICSKIRKVLMLKNSTRFFLHLGLAAGLLGVDELNLGLISFIDRHLEYNEGIRMAAQSVLGRLPLTFNGLHLRMSHEAAMAWKIVLPDKVMPKLMELGFQFNTTIFVASGAPALKWDGRDGLRVCMRLFLCMCVVVAHW